MSIDWNKAGALWNALRTAESPEQVLKAGEHLLHLFAEHQNFHNAAEAVMSAVVRLESLNATATADAWLSDVHQRDLSHGLLTQSFFRNWLSERAGRHVAGHRGDIGSLDHSSNEPRSIPCEGAEDDETLIARCDDAFRDLAAWLADHDQWSLGGKAALVAMNRSRNRWHRSNTPHLFNPATFGLRFVDPLGADEAERSSLLSRIAHGSVRVLAVKLGVLPPKEDEAPNVLD
jgi:hypothetical protein